MVEITVEYEGNFHCQTVHGPSGARLPTDAPKDNLGKGEAFSPTDLTATSLGVCMLTTMAIVATRQSLDLDLSGARATVRKHMTASPPRRISKIEVRLEMPLSETHPACNVLRDAAIHCPVALSLHPEVEKAITFSWKA